jgi:hypothetical protein
MVLCETIAYAIILNTHKFAMQGLLLFHVSMGFRKWKKICWIYRSQCQTLSLKAISWVHEHMLIEFTRPHTPIAQSLKVLVICHSALLINFVVYLSYPKHHEHKGDLGVTPETYVTIGERAQMILVWVGAPNVGNAFQPQRIRVSRIRPWAMRSSWREDYKMLNNTSIGGVR